MAFTNYYKILNINPNANLDEIKKSYRKLALQYHPDRNKGKTAAENFKKITEAYNVLRDSQKRAEFDRYFSAETKTQKTNPPVAPRAKRGINLKYHLKVSLADLVNGATKSISYMRTTTKGSVEQTLSVEVPPLSTSGQRLKVSYMGDESLEGGIAGDLVIIVESQDNGFMKRDGYNIVATIPITFIEAITGAILSFQWKGESIKIETPAGLPPFFSKKLKGLGLHNSETNKSGDLIINVVVEVPSQATDEQKSILKEIINRLPATSLRKSFLEMNSRRN